MKKGLVLGRFQPFHLGHLSLIQTVLKDKKEPLICIGSAQCAHTKDNPFTVKERKDMIKLVMAELNCNYTIYEIPDINNYDKYVSHLEEFVPKFDTVYSGNTLVQRLFQTAGYEIVIPKMINREVWEGAAIRRAMTEGDEWEEAIPPQIVDMIYHLNVIERLKNLA
tara:strand:- start:320 stop:817 length:498 start_codon:yes stop_codon:yes gene_type:complete